MNPKNKGRAEGIILGLWFGGHNVLIDLAGLSMKITKPEIIIRKK